MSEMEIQTKKKWLYRYRDNKLKIKRLENKLKEIDSRMKSPRSVTFSNMPKGERITVEDFISEKEDLEKRIVLQKKKGLVYRQEIVAVIDEMENSKYAEVLELWFIDGYNADEIAEAMGYSTRYIFSLYSKALDQIDISRCVE